MRTNQRVIGFVSGLRYVALGCVAAVLLTSLLPSLGVAQIVQPGLGVFGEATRPDTLKLDNGGFDDELLPVNLNGYWGLLNQRIRLITVPEFDWTDDGFDGLARATLNGKTGFLQGNGDWRFAPEFDEVDRFAEGFAVFRGPEGGYGYLDKGKKIRHQPGFKAALRFKEGRAVVQIDDRCGYLDLRMQLATPLAFTAARSFHDGVAAVRLAEDSGSPSTGSAEHPDDKKAKRDQVHDGDGDDDYRPHATGLNLEPAEPVSPPTPDAQTQGRWAFINKTGRTVFVDPTGDIEALGDFNNNLVRFKSGGKWGYLDQQFRVAVEPVYEDARDFTNGLAAVKYDGMWGFIDRRFEVVIPFAYDEADDFDETLAMVKVDGKIGFIDRTGRMRIEPQFTSAEPFRDGVARVGRDDSFAYIGVSGYVFFDPRDTRNGVVDVRNRENVRIRSGNDYVPYNRFYRLPAPRKTLPRPYPPEHLYDEGLDIDVPWRLGSKP